MKKKFIFLTMMLLTFLGVNLNVLNAQQDYIVGDGVGYTTNVPYNTYNYATYSQQILTDEQITFNAGLISKIAFNVKRSNNATRNSINIYMLHTDKTSFTSNNDWVSITEDYLVYSGPISINTTGWLEITLATQFEYEGGNILICVQDNSITYTDLKAQFLTNDASNTALTKYADNMNGFHHGSLPEGSRETSNQIKFTWESSAPAVMPSSVPEITSIEATHNSVTLAWNAVENAKKYNVYTSTGDLVETVNTTSCTIEGLDELTEYCYQVSAVNGEFETKKSAESCTTTLEAPETRNIVFTLNDSYGDGWNGNAYLQIDATDGTSEQLKCSSGYSISYDVEITVGATVYVTYMISSNNWPDENSYCIHYDDETEIYCSPTMDNTSARSYTFIVESLAPEVTIAASAYDIYSDQTATLTATAANFDGDVEYSWYSNEEIVGTGATYTFDPSAEGIYTFTCTATDANNNEASESVTINVTERPALALDVTAEKTEIYQGQYTMLDAKATGGFPPYTYKWFLNGEENGTGASYYFNQTETGEYTIKCEVTDDNNGTTEKDVTVSVLADPFAGKQFRVKVMEGSSAGYYLDVYNDNGTIGVESKTERNTQIFTIEIAGNQYYLKTADGYYIKCETGSNWWNVHANNTYDKTPLVFEYTDGEQFYIKDYDKMTGNSQTDSNDPNNCYFKVENAKVYCDAPINKYVSDSHRTVLWSFEEVLPSPEIAIVEGEKTQLYPGETTEISWNALEGAASYNVYVNGVKFNTEAVEDLSYELVNLPYGMNTIAVAAVFADDSESGMSNTVTVQMAGTFPLTIKVQDMNGNAVANASLTIEGTDEYQAYRTFEGTTDVNGEWYKADMPLLYQWFSYNIMVSAEPFEDRNSVFYESETDNGVAFTQTIEMKLPTIEARTEKESYEANEDIVLFWNAVDSEYLQGYNVYVNDEKRNTELLTSTIYTLEGGLAETGYISVTAVYEGYGESAKGYGTYVNINTYGTISGTVTDGTNPIVGAEVVVEGRDKNWNEQRYTTLTNAEGAFELEVLPSFEYNDNDCYSVSVSKYGYSSYKSTEKYKAVVDSDIVLDAIVLTANADVEFAVEATEENGNVTVTWEAPEGATQYNVFRKDATEAVVKLTEAPITEQEYLATDWNELSNGTYQYGVSAIVGGGEATILNETFENGMPEGWTTEKDSENITSWEVKATDFTSIEHIDGSYVFTKGTVSNGYSILKTTEYIIPNDAKLMFEYYSKPWGSDIDYLEIYAVNENNVEDLLITANNYNAWTTVEVPLSQYAGQRIKLYFKGVIKWGNGLAIDNIKITGDNTFESSINWATAIEKNDANVFTDTGEWTSAANWSNGLPDGGANVFIEGDVTIASNVNVNNMTINGGSVTINNGASLTVEGTLVNEAAANLVINDGAQIFQNNEDVPATFVMGITKPKEWQSDNKDGWQFISSPFTNASVFNFTNASEGNYDLFKYDGDEDLEWRNHKVNAASFGPTFEQGVGYLASHETESTIELTGTLKAENYYSWDYLYYNEEKPLANFYLLGNPFPFNMDITKATFTNLVEGVAVVTSDGGYDYSQKTIPVGDAFFVQANGNDYNSSLSYGGRGARSEKSNSLNITATGNAGKDNVVINFAGKSEGFNKLQNFNDAIATVYVAEDGKNYGIYNCDADVQEVELNFNANKMGNYTISIEPDGEFETVTLVDRFTGVETNMLEGEYTFTAMSSDNHNRFVLRMVNGQQTTDNSHFVYQSGEELILNIQGEVQIVDVLGRVVYNGKAMNDINRINVSSFNSGAYMVKVMNGNEVKVEKIIL